MRIILSTLLIVLAFGVAAQNDEEKMRQEIVDFQEEQNEHYFNKKKSPLPKKERKAFKGHSFYPIDLDYVVEASFQRILKEDTVELITVQENVKYYVPYAKVYFKIKGESCQLTVFQNLRLRDSKEYGQYLFIPFRDATSGKTSYGGGRYLDILIPKGNKIVLNFNMAYNPYCAYTSGYNCTIPPEENTLTVPIKAGLMVPDGH